MKTNTMLLLLFLIGAVATQSPAQTITGDNFDDDNDDGWSHVNGP